MAKGNNAPVRIAPIVSLGGKPPSHAVLGERALVLGGGGSAGNAWEIVVIAGLFEAGLDLTEADLIIGTTAGATVAAQITSTPPPELLAGILAEAPPLSGQGRLRQRTPSRWVGGRPHGHNEPDHRGCCGSG